MFDDGYLLSISPSAVPEAVVEKSSTLKQSAYYYRISFDYITLKKAVGKGVGFSNHHSV